MIKLARNQRNAHSVINSWKEKYVKSTQDIPRLICTTQKLALKNSQRLQNKKTQHTKNQNPNLWLRSTIQSVLGKSKSIPEDRAGLKELRSRDSKRWQTRDRAQS